MTQITASATQTRPLSGSIVQNADADEAMSIGDFVRATATGVAKANATTSAGVKGRIGVVVAGEQHTASGAIASGERVAVCWFGRVYLGSAASLDPTKQYFIDTTAGKIVDAVGSGYARAVGYADEDGVLFLNPDSEQPAS